MLKKQKEKATTILDSPRKLIIPDCSGNGNHLTMVVNWNPFIKNCEYIKLIQTNGDECIVQKDEFRGLIMMIAKEEEISDMGKVRVRTVRVIEKPVTIQLTRNCKKGEIITVMDRFKFEQPQDIVVNQANKSR